MAEETRRYLGTAHAAYQRFADRVSRADRDQPTRLEGWTVGDLADHVTWGAAMEAEAIRVIAGGAGVDTVEGDLAAAVGAFEQIIDVDVPAETMVTVPAGTVPLAFAAPLFAFEAALHASDLEHALGEDARLRAEELDACAVVIGPMLDLVATMPPAEPIALDLVGLGEGIRLMARDGVWRRGVPDRAVGATTTVSGTADDIVLFAAGRVAADALEVSGDRTHAERFKQYFPGP